MMQKETKKSRLSEKWLKIYSQTGKEISPSQKFQARIPGVLKRHFKKLAKKKHQHKAKKVQAFTKRLLLKK
jgi:hypothetical protein